MWLTILLAFLAFFAFAVGMALILDWWQPFKKETIDEKGEKKIEKVPLTSREKWTVGALMFSAIVALLSLLFVTNPPWLVKWRERVNGAKAKA